MLSNDLVMEDNKIKINKLKRILFLILFTLSLLQQMPIVKDTIYNELRILLYILFIIFGSLTLPAIKNFLKIKFNSYFFLILLYFIFISLILKNTFIFFEMLIPFIIYMCSFNTHYNNKQLYKVLIWYVILSALVGLTSIFYYGDGIIITEQYFLKSKNQIGPMIGYASFLVGFWLVNGINNDKKKSLFRYILYLCLFGMLFISILVIRNRTGILSFCITFLFLLSKKIKLKFTFIQIILFCFISITLIIFLNSEVFIMTMRFIAGSLFNNYNVNDLNSISAGRTDVYLNALLFIKRHPLLGELGAKSYLVGIPHNYILNKWVNLGLIISLPLIIFYLYLWKNVIQNLLKNKISMLDSLPIWLLFFSLIISIFEYTYPYGPGVSQMLIWFLLGQYYRGMRINKFK